MATLGAVYDRINSDYLNRTDLTAETKRAVAGAVRFYERQRFWFNETATAVTTTATSKDVGLPANLLIIDSVEYKAGPWEVLPVSFGEMRELQRGSATGRPTHFCYHADRLQLFPSPDTSYSLSVAYIKQLTVLSATTGTASTNAWFSACEDLIVFHATKLMWANVLRNTEEALKYSELEKREFDRIMGANEQRMMFGIKATRF